MNRIDRRNVNLHVPLRVLRRIARWVRIQSVRWWIAVLALVAGLVIGYGIAEWNFAHACSNAMVTATRFEEGMDPFIAHPDDGAAHSRLVELRAEYGRELADCQQSFFIR